MSGRRWAGIAPVLFAVVLTWAGLAHALQLPKLQRRVTDLAGVLSATQQAELEQTLQQYEQRTGHQFAVLTVPSLDGDPLEDVSIRVAEEWKLGDPKRDDGLIVLLALKERKVRIEVGYGLEGVVTDAVAGQVISQTMAPHFRGGDYGTGLLEALSRLMAVAAGEATGQAKQHDQPAPGGARSWLVPLVIMIIVMLMSGGRRGGRRRGGFFMLPPIGMGGWSSGGRGGGGWGGGGFGGGGGRFGGGGASGGW